MFYGRGPRKAKAATTAEIIRFNESDIPGGGQVKAFFVDHTGTSANLSNVNNIIAKAGGRQFWNVNNLQHTALLQRYGKKAPATTVTRYTIPFYLGAVPGIVLGAPPRALAVEIDVNNTPGVGDIGLSYLIDETPTTHYPMFVQSQGNIGTSATNGRFPVTNPGLMRGVCLPRTTSITDLRIYVGNRAIFDLTGPQLLETQEMFQGGTVSLNDFIETPLVQIIPGETFIEITTDGSWASTDLISIMSFVPNDQ